MYTSLLWVALSWFAFAQPPVSTPTAPPGNSFLIPFRTNLTSSLHRIDNLPVDPNPLPSGAIITTLLHPSLPAALSAFPAEGDDAALLVRLRRCDPSAIGLLFDRYGKPAFNLALRLLGDPALAEDAVSQAILKCWNRIDTFRETRGSALGLWLLALTYSTALQILRPGDQTLHKAALERANLYQDWSKSLDLEEMEHCITRLPSLDESEAQLLTTAFFEGLTPVELTRRLGRPLNEVESLIASALAKLRSTDHG